MAFEGMDTDAINGFGHQLQTQENSLHTIVSTIDGIVNQMEGVWKGHDATQFQGWWTSQHRPALMAAAAAVGGLGQSAFNNAREQEAVSGH